MDLQYLERCLQLPYLYTHYHTEAVSITQDIVNPTALISPSITELTCSSTTATLDAAGSTTQGTISYSWSTGATTSSIDVTTAGTYTLTITDADNGCTGICYGNRISTRTCYIN